MKKTVVIIFAFLLSFCLFACGNASTDPDITDKITETIASVVSTSIKNAATVSLIEINKAADTKTISAKEAETVLSLLENGEWNNGATADCINDFSFTYNNKTYYYHSGCGTFNDNENERSLTLGETDKETVNNIFIKDFFSTSYCIRTVEEGAICIQPNSQIASDSVDDLPGVFETETVEETQIVNSLNNIGFQPTAAASVAANFGFRLFKEAVKSEENALISPVSIITALTMTAKGAKGETLEEMQKTMGASLETLNTVYSKEKIDGEGIKTANSIWVKKSAELSIKQSFADVNKKNFAAEVFSERFDSATLNKMNRWVSKNTDGMIKKGLDNLPADAIMYLINTVLFEAEWQNPFSPHEVRENVSFTTEDGEKQTVTMLTQDLTSGDVFTLGKAQGIKRKYTNGYSFAAILPNEGVSIIEALDSFTGGGFISAVAAPKSSDGLDGVYPVTVSLPKFEFECKFKFGEALKTLGMPTAFSSRADFSGIADSSQSLYISEVYHSTKISLTEKGTKAGAATHVEMKFGAAPSEKPYIVFNRPFIYVIFETGSGMPLFIGTVRGFEG